MKSKPSTALDDKGISGILHTDWSVCFVSGGKNVVSISRGEETRSAILAAAAASFAEHGYDGTGVAEICERAGVSKGAFYYHFEGKQALFLTLIEDWLQGVETALDNNNTEELSVPERLLEMSNSFQQRLAAEQPRLALILEFWTQATRDDTVRDAVLSPYRSFQRFFSALIQEGIAEGSIRTINPAAGAQVLLSLASGLFFQGLLAPTTADGAIEVAWGDVAKQSVRLLLTGLQTPTTEP